MNKNQTIGRPGTLICANNGLFKQKQSDDAKQVPRLLKGNVVIPCQHKKLITIIEQDIAMREQPQTKKIVLLEGSSGVGKSTILAAILEEQGFSQASTDPKKRYCRITGISQESMRQIKVAAQEGSMVILDEFNVVSNDTTKEEFEIFLSNLEITSGAMILASVNSANDLGRSAHSKRVINYTHLLHFDDYTDQELSKAIKLLHHLPEDKAQEYVRQFREAQAKQLKQKNDSKVVNYRAFFEQDNYDKIPTGISTVQLICSVSKCLF